MSDTARREAATLGAQFEGFRNFPYQDSAGVWTIGYGSTRDGAGHPITAQTPPITHATGLQWFTRDTSAAFATVAQDVRVPLTDGEEAALADFIYNLGAGAFASSTLLRLLNARQYGAAAAQFDRWDMAGGQVLAGLLRRREAEEALFNSGTPPTATVPS